MGLKLDWGNWLYGLFAGFIGGGAGSIAAALGAIGITPETYNLGGNFHNTLKLASFAFVVNGVITAAAFLHQNPLPEKEPVTTVVQTTTGPSSKPQTTTTVVQSGGAPTDIQKS